MKKVLLISCFLLIFTGCSLLDKASKKVKENEPIIKGTASGAASTGTPQGLILSGVLSAVLVVTKAYDELRKKKLKDVLASVTDRADMTELEVHEFRTVLKIVVDAIEDVSKISVSSGTTEVPNTIIKDRVKELLKENEIFIVGKRIITELKAST